MDQQNDAHRAASAAFNQSHIDAKALSVGATVWLIAIYAATGLRPNKFTPLKLGPYTIVKVVEGGTKAVVQCMLSHKYKIVPMWRILSLNSARLTVTDTVHTQLRALEQIVLAVHGSRTRAGKQELLIQWWGWDHIMSWEPVAHLQRVHIVRKYLNLPITTTDPWARVDSASSAPDATLAEPADIPSIPAETWLSDDDVEFYLNPPPGEGRKYVVPPAIGGPPPPRAGGKSRKQGTNLSALSGAFFAP
jgi:hypothetical protein